MVKREVVHRRLSDMVEHATKRYGDGTPFFDWIDQAVTTRDFFDYLRDRILDDGFRPDGIVTSGKFGWAFSAYAFNLGVLPKVLNFPGNLRHEKLTESWCNPNIEGQRFYFVDNSIYKARTLTQIEAYIERWGGKIVFANVLYDGSRPRDDGEHGWTRRGYPHDYLYRWHDGGFKP